MKSYAKSLVAGWIPGIFLLFISSFQNLYAQTTPLSGAYTIGGPTPDFASFSAAAAALTARGVSGPVVFEAAPGVYAEKLTLGAVLGASSVRTVLFRKKAGAAGEVLLGASSGAVDFTETDFIQFENITLRKTTTAGQAVNLRNKCTGIAFTACKFELAGGNTGIQGDGTFDSLYVGHCTFKAGGEGITLRGNGYLISYEVVIENNLFEDQEEGGILLYDHYFSGAVIRKNDLFSDSGSQYYGAIYASHSSDIKILGNRIRQDEGIGILCSSSGAIIANNMVYVSGYINSQGILSYCDYNAKIYYNAIHCTGEGNTAALSFNAGYGNEIYNNIAAHSNGGLAIRIYGTTPFEMDYNNLYTTGPILIAADQSEMANLAEWQMQTQRDSHSLSVPPAFFSDWNLHVQNPLLDGKGTPLSEITTDFDGDLRDPLTPDIGADEFSAQPLDAAVSDISSPKTPFAAGIQPIRLRLRNNGLNPLTSAQLSWQINGGPVHTFAWTGNLASAGGIEVQVGDYNFSEDSTYVLRAWSALPNGGADDVSANDTFSTGSLFAALCGQYTIGGSNPDFASFSTALQRLRTAGVSCGAVFSVRPGAYEEQLTVNRIPGANTESTVRFRGESADPAAACLSNTPGDNPFFTLKVQNARHLAFERLTIRGIQPFGYNNVTIVVSNQAYDIRFENCHLELADTSGSPAESGLVVQLEDVQQITVNGSVVRGGNYGLYASSSYQVSRGVSVFNSTFLNQTNAAINCYQTDSVVIVGNTLRSDPDNSGFSGILVSGGYNGPYIRGNKIDGNISLSSITGTSAQPAVFANNFVYNTAYRTSPILNISGSSHLGIFFNSFLATTFTSVAAVRIDYLSGPLEIKNNIIANSEKSPAIEVGADPQWIQLDYNNLYTPGDHLGNWNSQIAADLASWQSLSGKDAHSISLWPGFVSAEDLHVREPGLDSTGTPIAGILEDIDGDLRNPTHPDIGADEFARLPNDAGVVALVGPLPPYAIGQQMLKMAVRNFGTAPLSSLDIRFSVNGQPQPVYHWTGNIAPKDTAHFTVGMFNFTTPDYYSCVFYPENPNGQPDSQPLNDTLKTTLHPSLCGTYTVGGSFPDFPGMNEALAALNGLGVACPVTFQVRDGVHDMLSTTLSDFTGTGSDNPVIFRSESGSAANVKIRITGPSLKLQSVNHLSFENLNFESVSSSPQYLHVFSIYNDCHHIRWENCIITAKGNEASGIHSSYAADSTLIKGCTFTGGKYGLYLVGGASNMFIENNIFKSIAGYGVYLSGNYCRLTGNRVEATFSNSNGFYISGSGHQVLKNDLTVRTGAGIYAEGPSPLYSDEKILIANNFVKAIGSSQANCIRLYGRTGVYFNNCLVTSTNPGSAPLNAWDGAFDIRNNIFMNTGGGYAAVIRVDERVTADYNDLFTTGARFVNNSKSNTAYDNLAAWQAATGLDTHSLSVDPLFYPTTDLHIRQVALDRVGVPIAGVPDDYDGNSRDPEYPDIGADEFFPFNTDLAVKAILSPVSGCIGGQAETVAVSIANRGLEMQTGFTVFYQLDHHPPVAENVGAFTLVSGAIQPFSFTTPVNLSAQGNFKLRVWVQAATDENPANDTATANIRFGDFNLYLTVPEDSVCKGGYVTLIANQVSGASYLWQNGHTGSTLIETLTTDKTYTVTVTKNGCQHVDSAHIIVLPIPQQVEITPDGPTTFCPGESVTLQSNVAENIVWSTGETTPSILVSLGGDYWVTLTNSYDCKTFDHVPVAVWPTKVTGAGIICPGEQAVLELPFSLLTGQWSTGDTAQSITVSPQQTTTYYVYGTDVHNCQIADTVIIGVNTDSVTAPATELLPSDQSLNVSPKPAHFSWFPPAQALFFEVFIWPSEESRPMQPTISKTTSIHATANLANGRTYLWQVRSFNACTESWSDTMTFTTSNLPDLQVTKVIAPPSGLYGQNITVQWTVKNTGQKSTGAGSWTDKIWLETDDVFSHRVNLGSFPNVSYLNPGESYTQTKIVGIPANKVGYGYYKLVVETDTGLKIPELDEKNNTTTAQFLIDIPPLPDLEVASVGAPTAAFSGNTITVNWTVINTGNLSILRNWFDAVYISPDSVFSLLQAKKLAEVSYSGALSGYLQPDSTYSNAQPVKIPLDYSGIYWIHVLTDRANSGIEFLENNNSGTVTVPLVVTLTPPPDLEPYHINFPPAAVSGQPVAIGFEVRNNAAANYPGQSSWYDEVFISLSPVFDEKAVSVGKQYHTGGIAPGGSYPVSRVITLPQGISGEYYWHVQADAGNDVFEYIFENNNSAASDGVMQVALAPYPDFTVTNVTPDSLTAREAAPFSVHWTTHNAGNGANKGIYRDRIYLSESPDWNMGAGAKVLTTYTFNQVLFPGDSAVRKADLILPNLPAGQWYFFVETDAYNDEQEFGTEQNNIAHSVAVTIQPLHADLEITAFLAPEAANSGANIMVSWETANNGDVTTAANLWMDRLWLSKDTIPDGGDWQLAAVEHRGRLDTGKTYTVSQAVNIPNGLFGNYYLLIDVAHDWEAQADDANPANDLALRPMTIYLQSTPDLQISDLSAPVKVYASEKFYLHYTVANNGAGEVSGKSVSDRVVLSNDLYLKGADIDLGFRTATRTLLTGSSYTDSIQVTIPVYAAGNYYLLLQTDSKENIYEFQGESNNIAWLLLQITPINDVAGNLTVTEVETPDSALLGEPLSIRYVLKNTGDSLVSGTLRDASYLSTDQLFDDVSDRLHTISNYAVNLQPGDSLEQMLIAPALTAKAGDYFGLIRDNIAATTRESSFDDNLGVAQQSLFIDARPLALNVPDTTALHPGGYKYYKISVDAGKDLLITLRNVAVAGVNRGRLFVGFDRAPDGADFDITDDDGPETKLVLIPNTQAGNFYVLAQLGSTGGTMPAAEILARALPFSLLDVSPGHVGRGLVTTTLRGAGFRANTVVQIRKNGVVYAGAIISNLKNSMEMDVRWQLDSVPEDVYDVVAINGNEEVLLSAALTVEPAQQLRISVVENLPREIRVFNKVSLPIGFVNTGNLDVPLADATLLFPSFVKVSEVTSTPEKIIRLTQLIDTAVYYSDDMLSAGVSSMMPLILKNVKPGEKLFLSFQVSDLPSGVLPLEIQVFPYTVEQYIQKQALVVEEQRQEIASMTNPPANLLTAIADKDSFRNIMFQPFLVKGIFTEADVAAADVECRQCPGMITYRPGVNTGTAKYNNGEFAAEGSYLWEIGAPFGKAGGTLGWDLVYFTGTLDITATGVDRFEIHILSIHPYSGDYSLLTTWEPWHDYSWEIARADGGILNFDSSKFLLVDKLFREKNELCGGHFEIIQNGNSLFLVFRHRDRLPGERGCDGGPGLCGFPGGKGGPGGEGAAGGNGGNGGDACLGCQQGGDGGDGGPGGAGGGNGGNGGNGGDGISGSPESCGGSIGGNGGNGGWGGPAGNNPGSSGGKGGDGGDGGKGGDGGGGGGGGGNGGGGGKANPDDPESTDGPPGNGGDGGDGGKGGPGGPGGLGGFSGKPNKDNLPGNPGNPGNPGPYPDPEEPEPPVPFQCLVPVVECKEVEREYRCEIAAAECLADIAICALVTTGSAGTAAIPCYTWVAIKCAANVYAECGIGEAQKELKCASIGVGDIALASTHGPLSIVLEIIKTVIVTCMHTETNCIVIRVTKPCDPNEIVGPIGYDTLRWVSHNDQLRYQVNFENDSLLASAAAQRVTVRVPLSEKLNPFSLKIGGFGFAGMSFEVPDNTNAYNTVLPLRDSLGVNVEVTAGLDIVNREAFWVFQAIDPNTGVAPYSPEIGMLPINDATGKGQGYVRFLIKPVAGAQTGDTVTADAQIVFDINEPIPTNVWKNTIDAVAPVSALDSMPPVIAVDTLRLRWQGADDPGGSGIDFFSVYVARDTNAFEQWQSEVYGNTILFTGEAGHTYSFFTLATDHTGNREAMKNKADRTVRFDAFKTLDLAPALHLAPLCAGDTARIEWQSSGIPLVDVSIDSLNGAPVFAANAIPVENSPLIWNVPAGAGADSLLVRIRESGASAWADADTVLIYRTPLVQHTTDTTVCAGESLLLWAASDPAAISLVWNTGETTAEIVIFPSVSAIYSVTVTSDGGCTSQAAISVTALCPTPEGMAESLITKNSATLSWTAAVCADQYAVEYRLAGATGWETALSTGADTTLLLTGLLSDTLYEWRIRALCADTPGLPSSIRQFKTLPSVAVFEPDAGRPSVRCIPNPAGAECRLELTGFRGEQVYISLEDNLGKQVMFLEIPLPANGNTSQRLDLNAVAEGVYYIRVASKTEVFSIKLVHYAP